MPTLTKEVWFYSGALRIDQPVSGYRAGNDALLLAASIKTNPGDKCLDLGTGSGVIPLLINHRQSSLKVTGVEKDADNFRLARENCEKHDNIEIVHGDILNLPHDWYLQFDQVVTNPPYFDDPKAVRMSDAKAPSFVSGNVNLKTWIEVMLKMLKPRGTGTLIVRANSLEKVLHALFGKAGKMRILPIQSFANQPAKRILVQFRKGVKSESAILPALVMHEAGSDEKFSPLAAKILCGEMPIDMDP